MSAAPLVVCTHCDLVYQRKPLPPRETAYCVRCGAALYRAAGVNLDYLVALAVTGLVVFFIANFYPIVRIDVGAERSDTTLWGAIVATSASGYSSLAVMSALCVFVFPLLQIVGSLYVVLPLRFKRRPPGFVQTMHALAWMWPWSAVEVFMLGAIVAVVKLDNVASAVVTGPGFYGFGALTILLTMVGMFDLHELWEAADRAEPL